MGDGGTVQVKLPPKLHPVFSPPRGSVQYRWAKGGRGGAKSFNFAKMAAIWGYVEPLRILCTRQYQASIKESFHAELKSAIASEPWLSDYYDVGIDYLRAPDGTDFIFRGLERSIASIKSLAKIDLTIVEEAEDVSEASWLSLEATVFRQPGSELWALWNPKLDGSPVDMRFVKHPPANAVGTEINWEDNPWFPPGLEQLRARQQRILDPNTYSHVWEGAYLTNSVAQVYNGKWRVEEFEARPYWDGPYQGGDFGFSQDPTAGVRCWIDGDLLFIEREAGKVGLELDDYGDFFTEAIPDFADYVTRWDNARPESISHITRHGLRRSEAVDKWAGSIEDGIAFLRSFRQIIVHPRCRETIRELRLYSYKTDRLTGDVTTDIVDAWNHYLDALRYALAPMIRAQATAGMLLRKRHF